MSGIEAAFIAVLGRDAELKTSKAGKQYLRLACRVGDGEDSSWVSVSSFDQQALAAADKLTKGSKVYVECTGLRIDTWTAQDGTQKHGLSAMSFHTRLPAIGRNKRDGNGAPAAAPAKQPPRSSDLNDEIPF